jgi:hypothetical protein
MHFLAKSTLKNNRYHNVKYHLNLLSWLSMYRLIECESLSCSLKIFTVLTLLGDCKSNFRETLLDNVM